MKYIALLRAVNVAGKNKLKMADLRDALGSHGLQQVQTYIQSGNVLFESDETEEALKQQIEHAIEQRFGLSLTVVLRTLPELDELVDNCPFAEEREPGAGTSSPAGLYVALLTGPPGGDDLDRLDRYANDREQFHVVGRDIYLLLQQGMRQSKLAPPLNKMSTPATLRNWKTLNRLRTMAHDTE